MKKLSKKLLLASLGFGVATVAVPVVLTSCAPQQETPKQNAKLETAETFSYVGSINDLYKEDGTTMSVAQMLTNKIGSSEELKKEIVTNYDSLSTTQKESLTFTVTGSNDDAWVGDDTTWLENFNGTTVHYDITSSQLTISSLKNLQDQLTPTFLSTEFEKAGIEKLGENQAYQLTEGKKFVLSQDKTYFNISVDKVSTTTKAAIASYNFMIPVSDLNVELKDASLEITSTSNVDKKEAKIDATFDFGVEYKNEIEFSKDITLGQQQITLENVLDNLNWNAPATLADGETVKLNSEVVGESINTFNTTFEAKSDALQINGDTYNLTLLATPNTGYSWSDDTTTTKEIKLTGLKIDGIPVDLVREAVASTDAQDLSTTEIAVNTTADKLEEFLKTNLSLVTDKLSTDLFKNVDFDLNKLEAVADKQGQYTLTLTVTPKKGYAWTEGDFTTPKTVEVKALFAFADAKVTSEPIEYSTEIDLSSKNYVNTLEDLTKFLTEGTDMPKLKKVTESVIASLKSDTTNNVNIDADKVTFVADSISGDATNGYTLKVSVNATDGHFFELDKDNNPVKEKQLTIKLTNIKAAEAASVDTTDIKLASDELKITNEFQNSDKNKNDFNTWLETNKTEVKKAIEGKLTLTNATLGDTFKDVTVNSDTGDVTLKATATANKGFVFDNTSESTTKDIDVTISGIIWVQKVVDKNSTIEFADQQNLTCEKTEDSKTALNKELSNTNSELYKAIDKQIKNLIVDENKTTYIDRIEYVANSAKFTTYENSTDSVGKSTATAKFNVYVKDGYAFKDAKREDLVTVNLNDLIVKKKAASINKTDDHKYDTEISNISSDALSKETLKNYLDSNKTIIDNIITNLKTSDADFAKNVKDNFKLVDVKENGGKYYATISATAKDYFLFDNGTDTDTVDVELTNIQWKINGSKADDSTNFEYSQTIDIEGAATGDLIQTDIENYITTNKDTLIANILTEMDGKKDNFANIIIEYKDGSAQLDATTANKFTIIVTAKPKQGYTWEDKTSDPKEITVVISANNTKQ